MKINSPTEMGEVIREQRECLEMTQLELAKKAGVSRLWINQIEQGKANASFQLILQTLHSLDLTLQTSNKENYEKLPSYLL